jgi:cell division protein FtsB
LSDIGRRIRRHRLTRYASPDDPLPRRLRWVWPLLAAWLAYVGVFSDHSLLRIWQMGREQARMERTLREVQAEIDRLDREMRDPGMRRELAEKAMRERNGWARPGEIVYRIRGERADSLRP